MKTKNKPTLKFKMIRFLTLICFFNFSGINNGFTIVMVKAGEIHNGDFSTHLARQSAQLLNPLNWNRDLASKIKSKLFVRSPRTVHIASQRAIEKILMESTLLQVWVSQSIQKLSTKVEHLAYAVVGNNLLQETIVRVSNQSQEWTALTALTNSKEEGISHLTQWMNDDGDNLIAMGPPLLNESRQHSWLSERFSIWRWHKFKSPSLLKHTLIQNHALKLSHDIAVLHSNAMGISHTHQNHQGIVRLVFAQDKGQDDDGHLTEKSTQIINHPIALKTLRGDFILSSNLSLEVNL